MKRCQTCGKHEWERERQSSTRHVDRSIFAHMSESKRARWPRGPKPGQRREREEAAGVKALRASLTPKRDGTAKFKIVGMAADVHDRDKSHQHTWREVACESYKRDGHVIQPTKSEKQVDQVSLRVVGPRSVRIPRELRDTEIKDHAVGENPRKFPLRQQTKLW